VKIRVIRGKMNRPAVFHFPNLGLMLGRVPGDARILTRHYVSH